MDARRGFAAEPGIGQPQPRRESIPAIADRAAQKQQLTALGDNLALDLFSHENLPR
jgi:hypothetical protein